MKWLKRAGAVLFVVVVPGGMVIMLAGFLVQRYRKRILTPRPS